MVVEPKVRGFICTTAHKMGCEESVRRQIDYVKAKKNSLNHVKKPKSVLIIGASTGYGLSSRIMAAFGCGAATLGIMLEKEASEKRTATPGYYNTAAFEKLAAEEGLYAKSLNGDAFSEQMKSLAVETIKEDLGKIDMVIYSLAAPRRTDKNGITYNSVLKTTGENFTSKSLDLRSNEVTEFTVSPATEEEKLATVKVMGGEDWKEWIDVLYQADVLADSVITVAYSYIGPELTYPIYNHGTIGLAKTHLTQSAKKLNQEYGNHGMKAYVSVNKALVTQASAAIPIVPLYISILYRVMKTEGLHEGCMEQIERLFRERLLEDDVKVDEEGRIRMDDWEMRPDIQKKVTEYWSAVNTENLKEYADIEGYWEDFYHMFGFYYDTIDYSLDVEL